MKLKIIHLLRSDAKTVVSIGITYQGISIQSLLKNSVVKILSIAAKKMFNMAKPTPFNHFFLLIDLPLSDFLNI